MLQILDTLVLVLFVLFLIYIFRGYHLSRRERDYLDNHSEDATFDDNHNNKDDNAENSH